MWLWQKMDDVLRIMDCGLSLKDIHFNTFEM